MNNDVTYADAGKKKTILLACAIFAVLVSMLAYAYLNDNTSHSLIGGADGSTLMYVADGALDKAISECLLSNYSDPSGECIGEGHVVFGTEQVDNVMTVYGLSQQGSFGFQNNNFVKISGSSVIPTVFKLTANEDGSYTVTDVMYPEDGDKYLASVREMFPEKYESRAIEPAAADISTLEETEKSYAKDYLKRIGRTAAVGGYADFSYTILTDVGVSPEVSNSLIETYPQFPYWIGTREVVEDGTRFVFETEYCESANSIVYRKYAYGGMDNAETITIDALTGSPVSD